MIISIETSSDETDCSADGHHAVLEEKSKNQLCFGEFHGVSKS
jgi:hypothetical protein